MAGNALDRHLALIGFMGAGKSTLGRRVAAVLGRPFVDLDTRIEEATGRSIATIFAEDGEASFRQLEAELAVATLAPRELAVLALGGGAVTSEAVRAALARDAFTILIDVSLENAWERVAHSDRPLAQDRVAFARLYEERQALYEDAADGRATTLDDALLAAGGVHVERGSLELLGELVPGDGPVEIVADAHVAGIYGVQAQLALGGRDVAMHEVPQGEAAKAGAVLERLWRALSLDRRGTIVALGGGTATDLGGLAAATYLRGVDWVAVPTTVVGQVDAAIGGKTAIDLPTGKNLIGAFHWPVRTVIDPLLLETLDEAELLNGAAEIVKTGLLIGERIWERPLHEQVHRCAAFKSGICIRDPHERMGVRAQLNLGHTFGHALEAAAGYVNLSHGRAVALGLLAAVRLSNRHFGLDAGVEEEIERVLRPDPIRVDPDRAWEALLRDKKVVGGTPRLVLLEKLGQPIVGVELPAEEVRAELERLIAT